MRLNKNLFTWKNCFFLYYTENGSSFTIPGKLDKIRLKICIKKFNLLNFLSIEIIHLVKF